MINISKNQFRALVIIYLILSILSLYDVFVINPHIEFIDNYLYEQGLIFYPSEEYEIYFIIASISVILVILINTIGLLLFKSWARLLYLILFITPIPIYFIDDIVVFSSISQLFYDTAMILGGFIIALLYFSNVAEFFNKQNN